jgi:branched-chain amino acid transport system ATP-binding protein
MLEVRDMSVAYGGMPVLHSVSLTVNEGELVALLGRNGAGKTTTMRAIAGLVPFEGDITLEGRALGKVPAHTVVRIGASFAQEGKRVFTRLSVRDNLTLGGFTQRRNKQRFNETLEQSLALFPVLRRKLDDEAGTLSGGEQQMLVIAQALMASPKLLLIDEPSQGLAPLLVTEVFNALASLRAGGTSILLAEQVVDKVLPICDRICVLDLGRVAIEGTADEVASHPDLRKVYIGAGA